MNISDHKMELLKKQAAEQLRQLNLLKGETMNHIAANQTSNKPSEVNEPTVLAVSKANDLLAMEAANRADDILGFICGPVPSSCDKPKEPIGVLYYVINTHEQLNRLHNMLSAIENHLGMKR